MNRPTVDRVVPGGPRPGGVRAADRLNSSQPEGVSTTKGSRGDKTPLELFCREMASWSTEITELIATA